MRAKNAPQRRAVPAKPPRCKVRKLHSVRSSNLHKGRTARPGGPASQAKPDPVNTSPLRLRSSRRRAELPQVVDVGHDAAAVRRRLARVRHLGRVCLVAIADVHHRELQRPVLDAPDRNDIANGEVVQGFHVGRRRGRRLACWATNNRAHEATKAEEALVLRVPAPTAASEPAVRRRRRRRDRRVDEAPRTLR